ncbi:hypothetical protein SDC9_180153 [bioreactor metagenome]|uniref:IclR-ED domain-containing protein n=1 Tax=bioreactor metagenome TaxID=1076179 RepID=A0A645HA56_9ZZZZ
MVLLSYMDETRVKHLWLRDNGSSNLLGVSDYREFRKRCAAIAAKGEVVNMSDLPPGGTPEDTVFTMAVPIRCRGAVIAALGICFTAADDPAKAIDGCKRCAERISRLIS